MAIRPASFVAAASTVALVVALAAYAQTANTVSNATAQEPDPRDGGTAGNQVQLLGGTVCLPGTGMFFFAGPPEPRRSPKTSGEPGAHPAAETAGDPATSAAPAAREARPVPTQGRAPNARARAARSSR